jgi:hypothetical protein
MEGALPYGICTIWSSSGTVVRRIHVIEYKHIEFVLVPVFLGFNLLVTCNLEVVSAWGK